MESIKEYFSEDHDRLDALFSEFRSLKRKDPIAAKQKFKEFLKGLTRHIVWEEDVIFPAFENKTGMRDSGPTAMMRVEHRQIKEHLDAIHDKVRVADPNSDASEEALLEILEAHNAKEEGILYPSVDAQIGPRGVAAVQKEMEAIPEERYACCCHSHKEHAAS